jgi:hypothetical protein
MEVEGASSKGLINALIPHATLGPDCDQLFPKFQFVDAERPRAPLPFPILADSDLDRTGLSMYCISIPDNGDSSNVRRSRSDLEVARRHAGSLACCSGFCFCAISSDEPRGRKSFPGVRCDRAVLP